MPKIGGLERDLASYLRFYNHERTHHCYRTRGRTPASKAASTTSQ